MGSNEEPTVTGEIGEEHPLAGKEHLLDTHEGYIQAAAEHLDEIDPDAVASMMLVVNYKDDERVLSFPSVDVDRDWFTELSVLVSVHIGHIIRPHETPHERFQDVLEVVFTNLSELLFPFGTETYPEYEEEYDEEVVSIADEHDIHPSTVESILARAERTNE